MPLDKCSTHCSWRPDGAGGAWWRMNAVAFGEGALHRLGAAG